MGETKSMLVDDLIRRARQLAGAIPAGEFLADPPPLTAELLLEMADRLEAATKLERERWLAARKMIMAWSPEWIQGRD